MVSVTGLKAQLKKTNTQQQHARKPKLRALQFALKVFFQKQIMVPETMIEYYTGSVFDFFNSKSAALV
jgi:hypothetical protein